MVSFRELMRVEMFLELLMQHSDVLLFLVYWKAMVSKRWVLTSFHSSLVGTQCQLARSASFPPRRVHSTWMVLLIARLLRKWQRHKSALCSCGRTLARWQHHAWCVIGAHSSGVSLSPGSRLPVLGTCFQGTDPDSGFVNQPVKKFYQHWSCTLK